MEALFFIIRHIEKRITAFCAFPKKNRNTMGKAVQNDRKMYLPVWQEYDTGSGDHTKWE